MIPNRDYEELQLRESARNSPFVNFLKASGPAVILAFVLLILLGWYVISRSKVNPYFVLGLIFLLIIIMILRRGKKEKEIIPLNQICMMALAVMERRIGFIYPVGTRIYPGPFAKMRWEGIGWGELMRPWKWEVGMRIIFRDGLEKEVLILMDPYEGICTGVIDKPAGYTGELAKDYKVLVPQPIIQDSNSQTKKV